MRPIGGSKLLGITFALREELASDSGLKKEELQKNADAKVSGSLWASGQKNL